MTNNARKNLPPPTLNEEPPRELDFERGDQRGGRVGDRRNPDEVKAEFPPRRVREAGRTGGEVTHGEVTADDLAPETLLDEDRSRTPADESTREPADQMLRAADEAEIGIGTGPDEAERARTDDRARAVAGERDRRRSESLARHKSKERKAQRR